MVQHARQLDLVFGAVADPTRRAILRRLGRGPARVTEIARGFSCSLNAVSKHVKVLERARLVRREIRGRDHVCSLDLRALRQATAWIEETREFWEERLGAFEDYVIERRKRK